MASANDRLLVGIVKLLDGKLPQGFEHSVAGLPVVVDGEHHQRFGDQLFQQTESILLTQGLLCANHRDGSQRPSSGEDPQPPEHDLLRFVEEVMAPLDGGAQRSMSLRRVERPSIEQCQAIVEAAQQRVGREQAQSRGRQFDREWETIQPPGDLGDGPCIALIELKVRAHRPRSLHEQHHRFGRADRPGVPSLGRHRQRGQGILVLPTHSQGRAARHQDTGVREDFEDLAYLTARGEELLHVVEDEQSPGGTDHRIQCLDDAPVLGLVDAERSSDR